MNNHEKDEIIAGLRDRLQLIVDERVDANFKEAKEWLNLIIGWAMKILAVSIVIAIGVFTFFGLKTTCDLKTRLQSLETESVQKTNETISRIEERSNKEVEEAINKRLEKLDVESLYRARLDELYDLALVKSYSIQLEDSLDPFSRSTKLSKSDASRIIEILHEARDRSILVPACPKCLV